jgi:hypothetical protein
MVSVWLWPSAVIVVGAMELTEGTGTTGAAACVEKIALPPVVQVPVPFAPEQAVTSQR